MIAQSLIALGSQRGLMLTGIQLVEYREAMRLLKDKSLLDAVQYYVDNSPAFRKSISAIDVWEQWYQSKVLEDARVRTLDGVKRVRNVFLKNREQSLIHVVLDAEDIRKWLFEFKDGRSTQSVLNMRRDISVYSTFAFDEEYISVNPFASAILKQKKFGKIEEREIEVWTVDELISIFQKCEPRYLRLLIALAFTGIRPSEAFHVRLEDFHFSDGNYYLEVKRTKTGRTKSGKKRKIPLPPVFIEWWKYLQLIGKTGRLFDSTSQSVGYISRVIGEQSRRAGLAHKADGYRHSWISAMVSSGVEKQLVANQAGNSTPIIDAHYLNLMLQSEAEDWFSVSPARCGYKD